MAHTETPLQHFATLSAVCAYAATELVATLQDDLAHMENDEERATMEARIHDLEQASEIIARAADAQEALAAAEYWLQAEREKPGQATPERILEVIGNALHGTNAQEGGH